MGQFIANDKVTIITLTGAIVLAVLPTAHAIPRGQTSIKERIATIRAAVASGTISPVVQPDAGLVLLSEGFRNTFKAFENVGSPA
jgi:hypothetical protein